MSAQPVRRLSINRPSHFRPKLNHIINVASFNKGTAFTDGERDSLHLRGLLPPHVETLEEQCQRVLSQLRSFQNNLDKYIYLNSLLERNETLFYKTVIENLVETMPLIYTPTVGDACINFSYNWRIAQGMFLCKDDRNNIRQILDNWPHDQVEIIVVTDGSRILGLGDLGCNGQGIPIGKLSLYVAGAGFHPATTLPITLDLGTNNQKLLEDPLYVGMRHPRLPDEEYYPYLDEFMEAIFDKWPDVLLQFEDFSNEHAFGLLAKYKDKYRCFNDDIQGTGAVVVGGFINSIKIQGTRLQDSRLVFFGAGSAGIGVADQIVALMELNGISTEEARRCFWFVDSNGLVTTNRGDKLVEHKVRFARTDCEVQLKSLEDIVAYVKPTALIGLSGIGNSFSETVLCEMAKHNPRPIIMALSNPTRNAECTAEQAYRCTDGRAIFASGSPFDPVEYNGKTFYPGQGNNMYIFPGLGFGASLCRSNFVSDKMIVVAAQELARNVTEEELANGDIYPKLGRVRQVSTRIAAAVIEQAYKEGLAQLERPEGDLIEWIKFQMYDPKYFE